MVNEGEAEHGQVVIEDGDMFKKQFESSIANPAYSTNDNSKIQASKLDTNRLEVSKMSKISKGSAEP